MASPPTQRGDGTTPGSVFSKTLTASEVTAAGPPPEPASTRPESGLLFPRGDGVPATSSPP